MVKLEKLELLTYNTPPQEEVSSGYISVKVLFVMVDGDKSPSTENIPEDGGRKAPQQIKTKHHRKKRLKRRKTKNLQPMYVG
jgi:hypothetical protein